MIKIKEIFNKIINDEHIKNNNNNKSKIIMKISKKKWKLQNSAAVRCYQKVSRLNLQNF